MINRVFRFQTAINRILTKPESHELYSNTVPVFFSRLFARFSQKKHRKLFNNFTFPEEAKSVPFQNVMSSFAGGLASFRSVT